MEVSQQLIKKCIEKKNESCKEFYLKTMPYLRSVVRRYLKDDSYQKDVLQETYVLIFKSLITFDSNKGKLRSWLARIAVNTTLNYNKRVIKSIVVEFTPESHDGSTSPVVLQDMSNKDVLKKLKKMPIAFYEVFNLHVIEGFSHQEISSMLKINEVLSRKRLSKGREWVRLNFKEEYNEYIIPRTSKNTQK